jgi:hypothetical protein
MSRRVNQVLTVLTRCVISGDTHRGGKRAMAKKKTVKDEAVVVEGVTPTETPEAEQVTLQALVEEKDQTRAELSASPAPEAGKVEAGMAEEVTSFVKGGLEQMQQRLGNLETEAQRSLRSLMERGRESASREVGALRQRLNEGAQHLREKAAVQELEKRAIRVGGALRERLDGLQNRVVRMVGGVASQSQVELLNRELDRLSRKLDTLVAPRQEEPAKQDSPQA